MTGLPHHRCGGEDGCLRWEDRDIAATTQRREASPSFAILGVAGREMEKLTEHEIYRRYRSDLPEVNMCGRPYRWLGAVCDALDKMRLYHRLSV